MDEETAWRVFNEGQPLSVIIEGQRFEGVLVTGLELPGGVVELLLPTPIGRPDRRLRIHRDRVQLAP